MSHRMDISCYCAKDRCHSTAMHCYMFVMLWHDSVMSCQPWHDSLYCHARTGKERKMDIQERETPKVGKGHGIENGIEKYLIQIICNSCNSILTPELLKGLNYNACNSWGTTGCNTILSCFLSYICVTQGSSSGDVMSTPELLELFNFQLQVLQLKHLNHLRCCHHNTSAAFPWNMCY